MKEFSKKTSIILWTIISVILAIVYVVICRKFNVYSNHLDSERMIFSFGIIEFVGLHVIIGFKNLWDFIIEKRYWIALMCLALFTVFGINGSSMGAITNWILEPEKDNTILGIYRFIRSDEYAVDTLLTAGQVQNHFNQFSDLTRNADTDMFPTIYVPIQSILSLFRIYNIGYIIPNFSMAYSFAGAFKLLASLLITYEFFLILTKKKKYLSLVGTILVVASSFISWWFREAIEIVALGELALIGLDKFMLAKNKKDKIVWAIVLGYAMIAYALVLYPAWQISFGYLFLGLAIWMMIKNRKEYRFGKIDFICLFAFVMITSGVVLYFYHTSYEAIHSLIGTSYPGARNETGGNGIQYLFEYLYSFLLPLKQNVDTMQFASFMSFFPVPMIIAMIYVYKKEKHIEFIMPILVVLIVESIWCMSGLPGILAKGTLLNKVPVERCAVPIGLGLIYLYMYMFANIEEKFIKQTNAIYIILAILVLLFFVPVPDVLNTKKNLYISVMIETLGGFLLLNIGDKKYQNVFLGFAVIMTLISSLAVNPLTKGVTPITETDFAKAVQEIVEKNPTGVWMTENMDMVVSNYLVAQGAKTINSTAIYPNEEFWKTVLGSRVEENRDIWNRYSHIRMRMVDGESSVSLNGDDKIILNLNKNELKNLNVKYLVSYKNNLEEEANFKKIYAKENTTNLEIEGEYVSGIYIYEFVN